MSKIRRCPRCKGQSLSILETHDEFGQTDFGTVRTDDRGHLIPPSIFWFNPGDVTRVELECEGCGHRWNARTLVSG